MNSDGASGPVNRQPGGLPVLVRRLDPEVPLPAYAHPGDAGADLVTRIDVRLAPGERATVPTGIAVALPDGFAAFVHPRSGLAARRGLSVVNAPGTVDAGYRGEILVVLVNLDPHEPIELRRGDRIAQLVIQRVERARFVEAERLPGSVRGADGHGSTGGTAALDPTASAGSTASTGSAGSTASTGSAGSTASTGSAGSTAGSTATSTARVEG